MSERGAIKINKIAKGLNEVLGDFFRVFNDLRRVSFYVMNFCLVVCKSIKLKVFLVWGCYGWGKCGGSYLYDQWWVVKGVWDVEWIVVYEMKDMVAKKHMVVTGCQLR